MNEIVITSDNGLSLSSERSVCEILKQLDELKKQEAIIKEDLMEEMKKRGLVKIDTTKLTITYVDATTRESFDSKKLREEKPEIYDEYCRISPVKDSIRIKVK
jgi:predicted phage-related endonuclease